MPRSGSGIKGAKSAFGEFSPYFGGERETSVKSISQNTFEKIRVGKISGQGRSSITSPGSSGTATPLSRTFGSSCALSPWRVMMMVFGSCESR